MRVFIVPDGGSAGQTDHFAQIIAIHAALLPTGKIAYFSGDQHDPGQFAQGLFDSARLFDCASLNVGPCTPAPGITDLFCCGHAFLPSGRLLIAGGTLRFDGFEGTPDAWELDPPTATFNHVGTMSDGRWYPTLVTLGNGSVLCVSGINAAGTDQNRNLEVYTPSAAQWDVEGIVTHAFDTLYPRLHLLPDGRVFFVTPMNGQSGAWRLGDAAVTLNGASPFAGMGFSAYSSALLPLLPEEGYLPRVLVANMAQPLIGNLAAATPSWTPTGARNVPTAGTTLTNPKPVRFNGIVTILPTGEILSSGGEENYGDEAHPVHELELYRPSTNSWVALSTRTQVTRGYHSTALLMPDGRVWLAGSDKRCDWSFHNSAEHVQGTPEPTTAQEIGPGGPVDNRELRIEIFEPWYFNRPDRPTISVATANMTLGRNFTIETPQAASISRVAVIRAGSITHAFNSDQRYVGIPFTVASGNSLTAAIPDNENLLPPGPYLLFVLAQVSDPDSGATLDVPSTGVFVQVVNGKHSKELKPEIEYLKLEIEDLRKISEVVDPGPIERGDPAELFNRLAVAVDNLARASAGGARSFIKPGERPLLAHVPAARLAQVPIVPIAPDVLARQLKMEGMMAYARMNMPPNKARGTPAGHKMP